MAHSHFCSQTCIDDAEAKGPMILEVPYGHTTFKNGMNTAFISFFQRQFLRSLDCAVTDQFKASWRHIGTVCPPVRRIYKIVTPKGQLASYNAYK